MSEDFTDIFEAELEAQEHLLWSGQPQQGLMLRSSDMLLIPFSIMWGGFAIFWEVGVATSGAPFFFLLWGGMFVLVGLYFMIGRFFIDAQQRAQTYYAVTSERIIIVSGLLRREVRSLSLKGLPDMTFSQGRDGRGSIVFGSSPTNNPMVVRGWPGTEKVLPPTFEMINEARAVYDKIRAAQKRLAN
jgi:hypothetical protein